MAAMDINAEIGEGCGEDAELLAVVSSCSIACGGHAEGGAGRVAVGQDHRSGGVAHVEGFEVTKASGVEGRALLRQGARAGRKAGDLRTLVSRDINKVVSMKKFERFTDRRTRHFQFRRELALDDPCTGR